MASGKTQDGGNSALSRPITKGKSEFQWVPQGLRGVRAVGHVPRRAANRKWEQPKRELSLAGREARRETSSKSFGLRHGATGFGVYSAAFWFCFGPEFLHCALFLPFEMVTYILCHCILEIFALDFTGAYS